MTSILKRSVVEFISELTKTNTETNIIPEGIIKSFTVCEDILLDPGYLVVPIFVSCNSIFYGFSIFVRT